MATIICNQCQAEIEIPAGYNVPYIKCAVCGAPQRLQLNAPNEPRFKILDKKGRINAANQTVAEEIPEEPIEEQTDQPVQAPVKKAIPQKRMEHNPSFKPVEDDKMILDSMGEEGMKKAFELVAEYICSTSPKVRAAGRAKAIQKLMKEKYPASMATKAIEYAERSPDTMAYGKSKNIKKAIIIAAIAAVCVAAALSLI